MVCVEVVVSPEWKYHITIETPTWWEVEDWCKICIGEFDVNWYKLGIDPAEWVIDGRTRTTWYFKDEKHAILFKLRWC